MRYLQKSAYKTFVFVLINILIVFTLSFGAYADNEDVIAPELCVNETAAEYTVEDDTQQINFSDETLENNTFTQLEDETSEILDAEFNSNYIEPLEISCTETEKNPEEDVIPENDLSLSYSVDFQFSGTDMTINGGDSIGISDLISGLNLDVTADEIESVYSSNEELIGIESDSEGNVVIKSLAAFSSNEKISILLKNGEELILNCYDDALLSGTVDALNENGKIRFTYDSESKTLTIDSDTDTKVSTKAYNQSGGSKSIVADINSVSSYTILNSDIDTLVVGKNIETLSAKTFFDCNISNINLEDGLTEIGARAFGNNSSVSNIYIPQSVNKICEYSFIRCTKLSNVSLSSLSDGILIENNAFLNCENAVISAYDIPKGKLVSWYYNDGGNKILLGNLASEFQGKTVFAQLTDDPDFTDDSGNHKINDDSGNAFLNTNARVASNIEVFVVRLSDIGINNLLEVILLDDFGEIDPANYCVSIDENRVQLCFTEEFYNSLNKGQNNFNIIINGVNFAFQVNVA